MAHFATMRDLRKASADNGYHFFSKGAMRFFDSRVSSRLHGDYFVTSEAYRPGERKYTVRVVEDETGRVGDHSLFQAYDSLSGATAAAKRAAKKALKS